MRTDTGKYAFDQMALVVVVGQLCFVVGDDRIVLWHNSRGAADAQTSRARQGKSVGKRRRAA